MLNRRHFIHQGAAASAAGLSLSRMAGGSEADRTSRFPKPGQSNPRIKSVVRRDETMLRLGGHGSAYGMTWAHDDRQWVALVEGGGWAGLAPRLYFASALIAVHGGPREALFEAVAGYPVQSAQEFYNLKASFPAYYCAGTLAVDRHVYQYLSTSGAVLSYLDGEEFMPRALAASKLIYSADDARTWRNQNGSSPVVRERPAEQSAKTMIFWNEPSEMFSRVSLLQMGRGYEDNRDGFVYGYSNSRLRKTANDLVMFRVPKRQILERKAYEFFAGQGKGGELARWSKDIKTCVPVHDFPIGWNTLSVVYNKPLALYMMVASCERMIPDQARFAWNPSSLGFWAAATPWGPWEQIHEETQWTPGAPEAAAMRPMIAPKWIAPDGKSFWLVWTDMYHTKVFRKAFLKELYETTDPEKFNEGTERYRTYMPYYRFNTQRVDLLVG